VKGQSSFSIASIALKCRALARETAKPITANTLTSTIQVVTNLPGRGSFPGRGCEKVTSTFF
jgi:hypothetical protein